MGKAIHNLTHSDALVVFGVTGDLAHKMIFPALYAMAKHGTLKVPVIGVASSDQYLGYHKEDGVAKSSDVETYCAIKLFIESWRWQGVPWYIRSGKYLTETMAEVVVELKPPPQSLFDDSAPTEGPANYLRFRLSPNTAVALAARVKLVGEEFVGTQQELFLLDEQEGEEAPYERLLRDAMAGDGALFAREDAVEAAWTVVNPILNKHHAAHIYKRGSWGPKQADALIAASGSWRNPGDQRRKT